MTARRALALVEADDEPTKPKDIYAADKAKIAAVDWARLHVLSDRSPAISLPDRLRRLAMRGGGVRRHRGGFQFGDGQL